DPVAGRDHEGLRHARLVLHVVQQLHQRVAGDRHALQHGHRGGPVAEPDGQHAHCVSTAMSGPPALRCSWNARICSSMERSTLRTSTVSGTLSTTGAKLRMLVTPAATTRSHTSCAAAAGVASTTTEPP